MDKQEEALLSKEIELLMNERLQLLRVAGMATVLISNTDASTLPPIAVNAAEVLSELINALPDETLQESLDAVGAHSDDV